MEVEYVPDAPGRRKWFVLLWSEHPLRNWPVVRFQTKAVARWLLRELGLCRDEAEAILMIAERHPSTMKEIEGL